MFRAPAAQYQVLHTVHLVDFGRVHVSVEDRDVEVLGVRGNRLVGILIFRDGAKAGAAEGRVVKGNKDLLRPVGLGFIQLLLELRHLLFVRRPGGTPTRGLAIVVLAGPQKDEANAVVIKLVSELFFGDSELFQIGEDTQ